VTRRRLLIVLGAVALVVVVVVGLGQSKSIDETTTRITPAAMTARLAGSPPRLAALHAQANQLLAGSPSDVKKRIASFKGIPVVVNLWGSWCPPCRLELPFFQKAGVDFGKRVAFIGLNVLDNAGDARTLMRQIPVAYPSYKDIRGTTAQAAAGTNSGLPITVYFDRSGGRNQIHQGAYASEAELARDIRHYALGAPAT
jgi:cytochrome c biogenesis protein CcmG, thiol:disulfide interchange protein DsbE